MGKGAFVNFFEKDISYPDDLAKELKAVQEQRNTTPVEKSSGQYVPSPTNIAIMKHFDLTVRMISSMVEQGLSYVMGDYYIYVQFGGRPSITKSPNGMIKAMSKLASKSGYHANINTGCIFEGYEELRVTRDGMTDSLHLVNSPEAEIGESNIISPYAVVTLFKIGSTEIVSRKVIIVRQGEYIAAKNKGSSTHHVYPVPMAQKIALRRAAEEMAATLGVEDSVDLARLKSEVADHDKEYNLDEQPAPVTEEQALQLEATANDAGVDKMGFLGFYGAKSFGEFPAIKFDEAIKTLNEKNNRGTK